MCRYKTMKSLSHFCIALDFGGCIVEAKQCRMDQNAPSNATNTLSGRKPRLNQNLEPFDYRQTPLLTGLTVR